MKIQDQSNPKLKQVIAITWNSKGESRNWESPQISVSVVFPSFIDRVTFLCISIPEFSNVIDSCDKVSVKETTHILIKD